MQIYRTTTLDEIAALAGEWNSLAGGVPFRTFEWLGTWWRHYQPALTAAGRQVELYTLCVIDNNELIGLAPWYLDRSRSAGHIIRFLGSGEVCSDYLNVLSRPDRRTEVAETIADWLTQAGRGAGATDDRWDILEMTGVAANEEMPTLLGDRLCDRGAVVHTRQTTRTWRIELPRTFEEYLNLLSKSHRKQLRQFQRRFFETGRAVLRTVELPEHLDQGWHTLADLHQRRLESLGMMGSFKSASFTQFHRAASDALYRSGRLNLHWLEFDGRTLAAEYHLVGDDVMFAYQGGVEPEALEHEPGRLITLATVERAIGAGFRAFDFCRGDEPYKAHWRATPCDNLAWRIVCNRASARLRHSVWIAGQNARKWVKGNLQIALGITK